MKTLTVILTIALAATAIGWRTETTFLRTARDEHAAQVGRLEAALVSERADSSSLREKIAALESDLISAAATAKTAEARLAAASPAGDEQTLPVAPPATATAAVPARPDYPYEQIRLANLKSQYESSVRDIDRKMLELASAEASSQMSLKQLQAAPPKFQEQRTTADGSKTGIRTSQADRDRITAQWQTRIHQYQVHLRSIADARIRLQQEKSSLDAAYQAAAASGGGQ